MPGDRADPDAVAGPWPPQSPSPAGLGIRGGRRRDSRTAGAHPLRCGRRTAKTKKAVGAENGVGDLRRKRARIRGIERP
jgi:hypothetical protein